MDRSRRNVLRLAATGAALAALPRMVRAQTYPSRPVRVIVPYAPAGSPDILGRLIGAWLSERLGQPFVIDNRPGGGSNIGTEAVVNAAPDGHSLLVIAPANAINATYSPVAAQLPPAPLWRRKPGSVAHPVSNSRRRRRIMVSGM